MVWIIFLAPVFGNIDIVLWSYPVTWVQTGGLFILYYRSRKWTDAR